MSYNKSILKIVVMVFITLPLYINSLEEYDLNENFTVIEEGEFGFIESNKPPKYKGDHGEPKIIVPRYEENGTVYILTMRCNKGQKSEKNLIVEKQDGTSILDEKVVEGDKYQVFKFENEKDQEYKIYLKDQVDGKTRFDGIGFTYKTLTEPFPDEFMKELNSMSKKVRVPRKKTREADFEWDSLPSEYNVTAFDMVLVRKDITLKTEIKYIENYCFMEWFIKNSDKWGDKFLKKRIKGDKTATDKFIHRGHFNGTLYAEIQEPFPARFCYDVVYFEIGVGTGLVAGVTIAIVVGIVAISIAGFYFADKYLFRNKGPENASGAADKLESQQEANKEEGTKVATEEPDSDKKND